MLNENQAQNQEQNVDIALEKHGVVGKLHCPYYTDERADYFEQERNRGEDREQVLNKELYFNARVVKFILHEGVVKKVMCHLLDAKTKGCNSTLRKSGETKDCHIIS